jgi:hypothetical protein
MNLHLWNIYGKIIQFTGGTEQVSRILTRPNTSIKLLYKCIKSFHLTIILDVNHYMEN